ncbi:MAG: hypothetical protein F4073_09725 [Rhodobacteraceae bacterium]|nr:hypothetical protein [Paracoccaceae bacterium]MYF47269.1 hypothetical protein [Paracoccaceae bacterium]MYI92212.1 hypothetical protein [Paracoccaceae bacterium]
MTIQEIDQHLLKPCIAKKLNEYRIALGFDPIDGEDMELALQVMGGFFVRRNKERCEWAWNQLPIRMKGLSKKDRLTYYRWMLDNDESWSDWSFKKIVRG